MSSGSPALDAALRPGERPSRPLRILVVDDEESARKIIRQHLEAQGHEVQTAEDGLRGLERYQTQKWDLVLTDRIMPRMSGDTLAAEIKQIDADARVVLVTGHADQGPDPTRADSPFDLTIWKPLTPETIRAAVAALSGKTISKKSMKLSETGKASL